MGLETGSYISALVATNPVGATDQVAQGDDHIRFIKAKLLETFPNITGAVTATHTELNKIDGVTATTAQLNLAAIRELQVAVGDQSSAITTGTAKITFRMPYAMTLTAVRASLKTASSSGVVTFDINDGGTTVLSTKLTIDANEKTSESAATAAVISDSALDDDAEITIDIDTAGTGAVGPWVYLYGTRS